jgi:predicted TIM-barrel fold metal-dependent hydrolase
LTERIVDFHVHPMLSLISENDLLTELDKASVEAAVLLALDVDPQDLDRPDIKNLIFQRFLNLNIWDAPTAMHKIKGFLRMVETSNQLVAELANKHPQRFVGFGSINLSKGEAYVEDKIREIDSLGLKGIKFIPTLQFFNPARAGRRLEKVFKYCRKKEKIVMFHAGCDPYLWEYPEFSDEANPKHLRGIVKVFDNVPVVVAHAGSYSARSPGVWFNEALKLGESFENVWFDIAAVSYLITSRQYVEKVRKAVGMKRILFGSDYPTVQGVSIKAAVDEVKSSTHLTEEEKAQILGLNAISLLGL